MRKVGRKDALTKDYGPVILWADDLKEILEIVSDSENVLFVADDYAYDSVEEFVRERRGKPPGVVEIGTERPYVNVDLNSIRSRVTILPISLSNDELVSLGLFQKLDRVLTRCQRPNRWWFKPYTAPLLAFAGLWIILIPGTPSWIRLTISVAMSVVFAGAIYAGKVATRTHSLVRPLFRVDDKGFFERNRDAILLAAFSGVVGAVVGVAASKVADKLLSSVPQAFEQGASESSVKGK